MPDLAINTGPIIGLTAALGDLKILDALYKGILVTKEVFDELKAGGEDCLEIRSIAAATFIHVASTYQNIPVFLGAELDKGEASVIQAALQLKTPLVAIDEKQGRRIARLHGVKVTGSIGILLKAKRLGLVPDLENCFERMQAQGIWISRELREQALSE